jgi:hypothetical protein
VEAKAWKWKVDLEIAPRLMWREACTCHSFFTSLETSRQLCDEQGGQSSKCHTQNLPFTWLASGQEFWFAARISG